MRNALAHGDTAPRPLDLASLDEASTVLDAIASAIEAALHERLTRITRGIGGEQHDRRGHGLPASRPDRAAPRRHPAPDVSDRPAHGPYGDGTYYYLELEPHPNEFDNEPFAVVSASDEPVADAAVAAS